MPDSEYISMGSLLTFSSSLSSSTATKCVQIKFEFQFVHRLYTHSQTQQTHEHTHLNICKLRVGKCFGVHAYCDSKPKQMFLPCCTNVYSSLQATKTYNI